MEVNRFDELARLIGRARSRRQVLRAVAGGFAGAVALDGARSTIASGDGSTSTCAELGTVCSSTSSCCEGVCSGNRCVLCAVDTDCPGADVCVDNECVPAACDGESGCGPNQVCCDGTCALGDCCSDADCPGATVCLDSGNGIPTCEVVLCAAEDDCDLGAVCCGGVCQQTACCDTDVDCAAGALCCDGACIPCPDGGVCGAAGTGTCACPGGQMECAFGCAACCEDGDCGSGEGCNGGICVALCAVDSDCDANEACTGGFCACASGFMDCDGTCAECCTYTDCPGTDICRDGTCGPLCFDSGEDCDVDADCCEGACDNGTCSGFTVVALPDTGTGPSD